MVPDLAGVSSKSTAGGTSDGSDCAEDGGDGLVTLVVTVTREVIDGEAAAVVLGVRVGIMVDIGESGFIYLFSDGDYAGE